MMRLMSLMVLWVDSELSITIKDGNKSDTGRIYNPSTATSMGHVCHPFQPSVDFICIDSWITL